MEILDQVFLEVAKGAMPSFQHPFEAISDQLPVLLCRAAQVQVSASTLELHEVLLAISALLAHCQTFQIDKSSDIVSIN